MGMVALFALFPEIAKRETREVTILPPGYPADSPRIPPGRYGFVESYCVDPACDCRRVMVNVLSAEQRSHLATINHAFEPPPPGDVMEAEGQTFLDPLNTQSQWSEEFLDMFLKLVLPSPGYAARLVRHYMLVKEALEDPDHPIHQRIPPDVPARLPAPRRRGLPPPRRGFRKKWR